MTFESFDFVRENYKVTAPWAVAASIGFGLCLTMFCFEVIWWVKCQHLWKVSEVGRPIPLETRVRVNTNWLQ